MRRDAGFSLLEMVVATAILMVVTATVFGMMSLAQSAFQTQPEVADIQQRLRVAYDAIYKDLIMAGAGMYQRTHVGQSVAMSIGPLNYYFAPILPFRQGAVGDDGAGKFYQDRITIFYVPSTPAQTILNSDVTTGAGAVSIQLYAEDGSDCPNNPDGTTNSLCGFEVGDTAIVYDDAGSYDAFHITAVDRAASSVTATLNRPSGSTATTYKGHVNGGASMAVKAIERHYSLKSDPATDTYQLVQYDGSTNADVPIVDHVVNLKFDYYGDPQPPALKKPLIGPAGPWTTYGPRPPTLAGPPAYSIGENCTFWIDAGTDHQPISRLEVLNPSNSDSLVLLTPAQLTDGPWCPDAASANRWDADLLRIRKIGVTLRIETAAAGLRGPASLLFRHGGSSRDSGRWIPDQEIHFDVSPRNLNLGR